MNIYIVILKNGKRFYVESYQDYISVYNRYLKRYGNDLACVLKDYFHDSIEEIKRERVINNGKI